MTNDTTVRPQELAAEVERAWGQWLTMTRRTPGSAHPYVYASASRECERRMVFELTVPERMPPFEPHVLARFRRGDDRERDLLADLGKIGREASPAFKVVGQQDRFELKGRSGAVVIAGKVDARLLVENVCSAPIEVKAWAPSLVERVETFSDLFDNQWTRSGAYQLLSYLFGHNQPFGFLLLDRSGLPRLLPVELTDENLERMEEFLARAERVVGHAAGQTLPDYIDDAAECMRCPFYGSTCNPPLRSKVAQVIIDAELEAHLARWHELKPAGKEWQGLDMDLKRHLRGTEEAIVGPFSVHGRWGKTSRLELPAHLKKQFTVTDPKGRFTLDIERLS